MRVATLASDKSRRTRLALISDLTACTRASRSPRFPAASVASRVAPNDRPDVVEMRHNDMAHLQGCQRIGVLDDAGIVREKPQGVRIARNRSHQVRIQVGDHGLQEAGRESQRGLKCQI